MLCPDLIHILERATQYCAHDIHLRYAPGYDRFQVIYRNERKYVFEETLPGHQWVSVIESLKFYARYRSECRDEFQDVDIQLDRYALRIAFTPYPTHYLTIRLHHKNTTIHYAWSPSDLVFFKQWQDSQKILLIAGPMHSGKTTLYYHLLSQEHLHNHSVMSLEDPIEKSNQNFFQMAYKPQYFDRIASALVRFDLDLLGFGEIRREQDWRQLAFAAWSSIRVLTTCHATSSEILKTKIQTSLRQDYKLIDELLFGVAFCTKPGDLPTLIYYENFLR
ncbi:MAG: hypothetical protein FJ161_03485 [Gammaproteobacteria bacterium]|nr:hypothetical protein [Gammaproteobacteria bacterium]